METGINDHIKEYVDYYIGLTKPPEFAILLRGKWGTGKSWFIKNYIKDKGADQFLYVSLYGITSLTEIEDLFFEQLHPILASKGMKIAGKILKGVLKTTIKIDIDSDKKDINISSGIPDFTIPDYLKKLDGKTIIFDDLERCSLTVPQILGYINQYVETNGLKVIIIANEEEIIKSDDAQNKSENASRYLTIKEKLIGKSFDVESEKYAALMDFIDALDNENCKNYLIFYQGILTMFFRDSGYQNLRHLKQSLFDFERFYVLLDDDILACKPLMTHLTSLFFIISIELKSGSIHENEISNLFSLTNIIKKDLETKSAISQIRDKYRIFSNYAFHPLNSELWTELFRTGYLDKDQLNDELRASNYLSKEEEANWRKLMFFDSLEDSEFSSIYQEVHKEFVELKIDNPYIVVQITGLLIFLVKAKLINLSIDTITQIGKDNLLELQKRNLLDYHQLKGFPGDHSHGLGYAGKKIDEFEQFLIDSEEIVRKNELQTLPKRATSLIELLKSSPAKFIEKLDYLNPKFIGFTQAPVLAYINPNDFSDIFISLSNNNKTAIIDKLESRYSYGYNSPLEAEKEWLKEFASIIDEKSKEYTGTVSGYLLSNKISNALQRSMRRFNYSSSSQDSSLGD
jgi:hypothetical protein